MFFITLRCRRWLTLLGLLLGVSAGLPARSQSGLNSYLLAAGNSIAYGRLLPWPGTPGGYLLAGYGRFGYDSAFMNLGRLSPSLTVLHHRDYRLDIPLSYVFTASLQAGSCLVGGATSSSFGGSSPYVVCTDTLFARRWGVKFTNLGYSQRYVIKLLPNRANEFAAYTYTDGGDDEAMYRLSGKLTGAGFRGRLMTPTTSGGRVRVFDGIPTGVRPDQHYLVGTGRIFPGSNLMDGLILKVDSSRVRWGKLLHFGLDFEAINGIAPTTDGKLVVTIVNYGLAGPTYPTVVCKLDTAGHLLWSKRLALPSGSLFLSLVAETAQQELVLVGVDATYALVIVKLSAAGNLIWTRRSITTPGIPNQLLRSPGGSFLLVSQGYRLTQFDAGGNGCDLVPEPTLTIADAAATATVTDFPMTLTAFVPQTQDQPTRSRTQPLTRGTVCVAANGLAEEFRAHPLSITPNPTSGDVLLAGLADGNGRLPSEVVLIDGLGRTVRRCEVRADRLRLDLHGLAPGLYTVRAGRRLGQLVVE